MRRKKMKKIIVLLLALFLALSFPACNTDDGVQAEDETALETAPDQDPVAQIRMLFRQYEAAREEGGEERYAAEIMRALRDDPGNFFEALILDIADDTVSTRHLLSLASEQIAFAIEEGEETLLQAYEAALAYAQTLDLEDGIARILALLRANIQRNLD
jgi:hypothetical protein